MITENDDYQKGLNVLLQARVEPPVLAYPDYENEFVLHVDAIDKFITTSNWQTIVLIRTIR